MMTPDEELAFYATRFLATITPRLLEPVVEWTKRNAWPTMVVHGYGIVSDPRPYHYPPDIQVHADRAKDISDAVGRALKAVADQRTLGEYARLADLLEARKNPANDAKRNEALDYAIGIERMKIACGHHPPVDAMKYARLMR